MNTIIKFSLIILSLMFISCDVSETNYIDEWTKGFNIEPADDSSLNDSLKNLYREDATRLALKHILKIEEYRLTMTEIPEELIYIYYNGLIHIYNDVELNGRDKIIDKYGIHTSKNPELYSISVGVDTSSVWVEAWRNGERLTGNPVIDTLMINYNLELAIYYGGNFSTAILSSPTPINTTALSYKFSLIDGIRYANPRIWVGVRKDIDAELQTTKVQYLFIYGWGDCIAGCAGWHYWQYSVVSSGNVNFIRDYGDPLPL